MQFLVELWLPIVVTSIVLFFVSAAAWMLSPHHHADYQQVPNEDEFIAQVRTGQIAPGRYVFPFSGSHQNAKDPEFQRKFKAGPTGTLTVFGPMTMGKNMGLTFLFFLVTNAMLAYLAWLAIGKTTPTFMDTFRFVGTASILAYTCGSIPNDIWFKRPLWTNVLDGIIYGLICGLIFASLWPAAQAML